MSYLIDTLLWSVATISIYLLAQQLFKLSGQNPLLHPLIVSIATIIALLSLFNIPVSDYQSSTFVLDWLLGPATIALAVPLYLKLAQIKGKGTILFTAIVAGGLTAPIVAGLTMWLGEVDVTLINTMLTKSITSPLAIEVSQIIQGIPPLAAGFVVITGIIGASICRPVFKLFNVESDEAKGIALGTIAHGVGTAEAFTINEKCGSFATLALCINGIVTSIALPVLYFILN